MHNVGIRFNIVQLAPNLAMDGICVSGFVPSVSLFLLPSGVLSFMLGIVSKCAGLIDEEEKMIPSFIVSPTLGVSDV